MSRAANAYPSISQVEADELPTLKGQSDVVSYAQSVGFTSCSARYVREETRAGCLPVFRIANAYFYSRADVRRWLLSKRSTPSAQKPDRVVP